MVLNEKLPVVMGGDVTQEQAFAHANDVLKSAVGSVSDIIHIPGLLKVDFEGVETMMGEPGLVVVGTATAGMATFRLAESPSIAGRRCLPFAAAPPTTEAWATSGA